MPTPADYGMRTCPRCSTMLTNVVNDRTGELLFWSCLRCWVSFDPSDATRQHMLEEFDQSIEALRIT